MGESINKGRTIASDDGQNKCPKCGATDISVNPKTGKLRCNFCRFEFEPDLVEDKGPEDLEGTNIGAGASKIEEDAQDMVTLKCQSCGAEVVIDTTSSTQARCHWCRNTLSINNQIANGAVPDVILPFKVTKEEARDRIASFVGRRKFFAHPRFRREFTTENISGVYLPYMIVDMKGHMELSGVGEVTVGEYNVGSDDKKRIVYDVDVYNVSRSFDIDIDDLTIESSSDKLDVSNRTKTNNIINSIMPFDTDNVVKYNSNYLKGFTSEKRDTNVEDLKDLSNIQASDIARYSTNSTLNKYDRGVRWDKESFNISGQSWTAAYLPVWLYSYMETKGSQKVLHYVAVNARTKETMGSVPINMGRLVFMSAIVEIFGILIGFILSMSQTRDSDYTWIFYLLGFIYFMVMYMRYRNSNARHTYERETKFEIKNMQTSDQKIRTMHGVESSSMSEANNKLLKGKRSAFNLDDFRDIIGK
jgi:hypothetical protein